MGTDQAGSSSGGGLFSSSATGIAVFAISGTPNGSAAIEGYSNSSAAGTNTLGVLGYSVTPDGIGTRGLWLANSTVGAGQAQAGVWGDSNAGRRVLGTSDSGVGVWGYRQTTMAFGKTMQW